MRGRQLPLSPGWDLDTGQREGSRSATLSSKCMCQVHQRDSKAALFAVLGTLADDRSFPMCKLNIELHDLRTSSTKSVGGLTEGKTLKLLSAKNCSLVEPLSSICSG
mmetsp:Transcript_82231/g.172156  ORF Transcript_82231/g.172156 Transcript_82231/m.172156 type:complete len:107 (+) Transcript_82231:207-527(+)